MTENQGYTKYLNKIIRLSIDSGDNKIFFYEGAVLEVNESLVTLDDIKEGKIDIPIARIIKIKEKEEIEWMKFIKNI